MDDVDSTDFAFVISVSVTTGLEVTLRVDENWIEVSRLSECEPSDNTDLSLDFESGFTLSTVLTVEALENEV